MLKQSGSLVAGAAGATIGKVASAPFALYSKWFGTGKFADDWANRDIKKDVHDMYFDLSGI